MRNLKGSVSQILIAGVTAKDARHLQRITDVITDIKAEVNMKNYSTYFFFDGANKELAKVILDEAENNGCKISKRQYSRQGEAMIITAKTWHADISMRAWKRILEQKRR